MTDGPGEVVLTRAGWWRGVREILPLCSFVLVLGATFGVAARQAGLSVGLASLMSAAVFAGGSQFAALGLLGPPKFLLPLLLGTFAINARLLLLSASLAPWFSRLPRWKQMTGVALLSDANWAQAMRAHAAGERDAGVLVGAGAAMWVVWVAGTAAGAMLAAAIPDPRRFGLDALLTAFFAAALVEAWRGRDDVAVVVCAALATLATAQLGAAHWGVLIGALTGAAAGTLNDARSR
jgi:4-azaleucine resistance transporter AzlC